MGDPGQSSSPAHTSRLLVSIVTPTYNSALYLRQTVESVAKQVYQPIEHIVVDGGSSDGTLRIVQDYPHIRRISEPDTGMFDAINKGLRMARGSILAYLNGDDLYFPDTVERVVAHFEKYPEAGLVFGYCRYIDPDGKELFVRRYPEFNWRLYSVLDAHDPAAVGILAKASARNSRLLRRFVSHGRRFRVFYTGGENLWREENRGSPACSVPVSSRDADDQQEEHQRRGDQIDTRSPQGGPFMGRSFPPSDRYGPVLDRELQACRR